MDVEETPTLRDMHVTVNYDTREVIVSREHRCTGSGGTCTFNGVTIPLIEWKVMNELWRLSFEQFGMLAKAA